MKKEADAGIVWEAAGTRGRRLLADKTHIQGAVVEEEIRRHALATEAGAAFGAEEMCDAVLVEGVRC